MVGTKSDDKAPGPVASALRHEFEKRNIPIMDFCYAVAEIGDDPPHWRSVHRVTTGETKSPHQAMRAAIEEFLGWPTGTVTRILAAGDRWSDVLADLESGSAKVELVDQVPELQRAFAQLVQDHRDLLGFLRTAGIVPRETEARR